MTDATQPHTLCADPELSASPNVGTFSEKVDLVRTDAPGMENDE